MNCFFVSGGMYGCITVGGTLGQGTECARMQAEGGVMVVAGRSYYRVETGVGKKGYVWWGKKKVVPIVSGTYKRDH